MQTVTDKLIKDGFEGLPKPSDAKYWGYPNGTLGEWYGGKFDLIAVIPDGAVFPVPYYQAARFVSKGDNRFVGVYTADEVLGE